MLKTFSQRANILKRESTIKDSMANQVSKVADTKIAPSLSIAEAITAGGAKFYSEQLWAQWPRMNGKPLIGNATYRSAAVKGVVAYLLMAGSKKTSMRAGKFALNSASLAHGVDAGEDFVAALSRTFSGKSQRSTQSKEIII